MRSVGATSARERSGRDWRAVQLAGLAATAILLGGLAWRPELTLEALWDVIIPLVPASLLITPMIWRNVCPLATIGELGNRVRTGVTPGARWAVAAPTVGIALLMVLVPARRLVFNLDATALAVTIAVVALTAGASGAVFDAKAGFCNALCPILPVERLYGQEPMIGIGNARCVACTRCSSTCLDLGPRTGAHRQLGPARHTTAWITKPFGAFAAAFPGFVLGYFVTSDGGWAPEVYVVVLGGAAASWGATAIVTGLLELPARRVLPALAALAVGTYYVFAAPALAGAFGLPGAVGEATRVVAVAFVGIWWWRADRRAR